VTKFWGHFGPKTKMEYRSEVPISTFWEFFWVEKKIHKSTDQYFRSVFFFFERPKLLIFKSDLVSTWHEYVRWFFLYNPSRDWGTLAVWSFEKNEFEILGFWEIWFSILAKFDPSLSQNFARWGHLFLRQGCREKISEPTHARLRLGRFWK